MEEDLNAQREPHDEEDKAGCPDCLACASVLQTGLARQRLYFSVVGLKMQATNMVKNPLVSHENCVQESVWYV